MHVLIDRSGVVRLYQPGRMSEAELEAAIDDVLRTLERYAGISPCAARVDDSFLCDLRILRG